MFRHLTPFLSVSLGSILWSRNQFLATSCSYPNRQEVHNSCLSEQPDLRGWWTDQGGVLLRPSWGLLDACTKHIQPTGNSIETPNRNWEEISDMISYLNFTLQIFHNFLNSLPRNCFLLCTLFFVLFYVMLGIGSRASWTLGKQTFYTELHALPQRLALAGLPSFESTQHEVAIIFKLLTKKILTLHIFQNLLPVFCPFPFIFQKRRHQTEGLLYRDLLVVKEMFVLRPHSSTCSASPFYLCISERLPACGFLPLLTFPLLPNAALLLEFSLSSHGSMCTVM